MHGAAQTVDGLVEVSADLLMSFAKRLFDARGQVPVRQSGQLCLQKRDQLRLLRLAERTRRFIDGRRLLLGADVDRQLDDASWHAGRVTHWVVGRLEPHLASVLGHPAKTLCHELPGV